MNRQNYDHNYSNNEGKIDEELESMLTDNPSEKKENKSAREKDGNKVLVKTSGSQLTTSTSGEEGYSTVVGVVLLIISVGFILAALIMAIPI